MAFAATKRKRIQSHIEQPRQVRMTSLIDMFTIILVFLLKSYSAVELNVTPSQYLSLPVSISSKMPEDTLVVTVAKNAIVVEGKPVAEVNRYGDVVGMDPEDIVIAPLYAVLKSHSDRLKARAEKFGTNFEGEITLQGDKEIPFKLLKRVMQTAGKAEFGEFKFATYKTE